MNSRLISLLAYLSLMQKRDESPLGRRRHELVRKLKGLV